MFRLALQLLELTERFRREQTITVPLSSAAVTAGAAQPVSSYLRALLGLLARRTILPAFERFVVRCPSSDGCGVGVSESGTPRSDSLIALCGFFPRPPRPQQVDQVRVLRDGKITAKKHMGILRNVERFPVRANSAPLKKKKVTR